MPWWTKEDIIDRKKIALWFWLESLPITLKYKKK